MGQARQARHVEGMGVGEGGALEAASFFSRLKASYRPRRVSHTYLVSSKLCHLHGKLWRGKKVKVRMQLTYRLPSSYGDPVGLV